MAFRSGVSRAFLDFAGSHSERLHVGRGVRVRVVLACNIVALVELRMDLRAVVGERFLQARIEGSLCGACRAFVRRLPLGIPCGLPRRFRLTRRRWFR